MASVGIVGLGKMGILHAGILNSLPEGKVLAVCEKEGMLRRVAKKILPDIAFYESAGEMVRKNEEMQAVYVTTPIVSHSAIVEELAKSGRKDVALFIEKPLAGSLGEAKSIVSYSSSLGTVNMVGFQKRFLPQFQRVKKLLDAKALGELFFFRGYSYVSGVFSNGGGWRFEKGQGGSLLDLGPHLIDLVLWYFGEPSSLKSFERSFYSRQVEDFSHVAFSFPGSGLVGHIDVSWSVPGYRLPETQLEIHGSNGDIMVSDDFLNMRINEEVPGVVSSGAANLTKPELIPGVDFLLADPEYCLEDKYFLDCVKIGKMPDPGLEAGLNVNKIVEAVHNSSPVKAGVA